jgi:flagellar hook-basal body complex protein FliE
MIPPIDALSALTQAQAPAASAGVNALPTAPTGNVSEGFQNILQPQISEATVPTAAVGSAGNPGTWGHMVQQMVLDVNSKQQTASQMVNDVLKGGPTPVHEAMVATEEAGLSFEFVAEMRNKIVDAYQQVMQMQV